MMGIERSEELPPADLPGGRREPCSPSGLRCYFAGKPSVLDVHAQISILDEEWNGLYEFIMSACSQPNDVCIEGMYLLGEVGYNNGGLVQENMQAIVQMLSSALQSSTLPVRVAASRVGMRERLEARR